MKLKRASLILLLILFVILVFIVGVRYGQRVEKTNKIINYLISIPPTPTLQPTQKPVEFKTYENKTCGIRFLYPSSLEKDFESSSSASFKEKHKKVLVFGCEKEDIAMLDAFEYPIWATQEVSFKKNKIISKTAPVGSYTINVLLIKNVLKNKSIYIYIEKSLYPLFEKSLEFLP